MSKTTAIKTKLTQSQAMAAIAEETGLSKGDVKAVLTATHDLAVKHIMKGGAGMFKIPFINIFLKVREIDAKPKRKGVNPFDRAAGEIWFKAKPASRRLKATFGKSLKDGAASGSAGKSSKKKSKKKSRVKKK